MQPHLQILYSLLMFLVLVPISTHIHPLVSCLFMTQPAHCFTTLSLGNAGTSGFPVTPGAASEHWERYCRSSFCLNSSLSRLPHSRHPARPSRSPQGASQQAEHHLCCLPGLKSICRLSLPTLTSNLSSRTPSGLFSTLPSAFNLGKTSLLLGLQTSHLPWFSTLVALWTQRWR